MTRLVNKTALFRLKEWRWLCQEEAASERIGQVAVAVTMGLGHEFCHALKEAEANALAEHATRYLAAHERGALVLSSALDEQHVRRTFSLINAWYDWSGLSPLSGDYERRTSTSVADQAVALWRDAVACERLSWRFGFIRRTTDSRWGRMAADHAHAALSYDPGIVQRLPPAEARKLVAAASMAVGVRPSSPATFGRDAPLRACSR